MSSQNGFSPWFSSPKSRRAFLQFSAAASTVAALRVMTEPMLARAAALPTPAPSTMTSAIWIDQNENPLGPCPAAREAVTGAATLLNPHSGLALRLADGADSQVALHGVVVLGTDMSPDTWPASEHCTHERSVRAYKGGVP